MSLSGVNFTYLNQPKMNTWPIFQELAFLEAELCSLFTHHAQIYHIFYQGTNMGT